MWTSLLDIIPQFKLWWMFWHRRKQSFRLNMGLCLWPQGWAWEQAGEKFFWQLWTSIAEPDRLAPAAGLGQPISFSGMAWMVEFQVNSGVQRLLSGPPPSCFNQAAVGALPSVGSGVQTHVSWSELLEQHKWHRALSPHRVGIARRKVSSAAGWLIEVPGGFIVQLLDLQSNSLLGMGSGHLTSWHLHWAALLSAVVGALADQGNIALVVVWVLGHIYLEGKHCLPALLLCFGNSLKGSWECSHTVACTY